MSDSDQDWVFRGRGLGPELSWSFTADAPFVGLALARETGDTLVADAAGSVYLLDRRGRVVTLSRGLHSLRDIAWSDAGNAGAVVVGETTVSLLNRQLRVTGSAEFYKTILAIAVDPFGHHCAVSLENGETRILNANCKTVGKFSTHRPLSHLRFVTTETELIGAADNGLMCRYTLSGTSVWGEPLWSNIGDLSITGDGQTIFVAGLNLGIQRFDGFGNSQGTYILEGTPNHVAVSYVLKRLIASTIEKGLVWLDADGEILWTAKTTEEILNLRCDALGTGVVCGFESGRIVRLDWGFPVA